MPPVDGPSTVRVEPSGITFGIADGEPVMAAALRHGHRWPTTCEGLASCGICYVELLEGAEHLGPVSDEERHVLDDLPARRFTKGLLRLACQATCSGDLVVRKKGVTLVEGVT